MMASGLFLFVGLLVAIAVAPALIVEAENPHPHPNPQELEQLHQLQQAADFGTGRGSRCSYRVRIKTSCRSPRLTRDLVALSFGDAYNNQEQESAATEKTRRWKSKGRTLFWQGNSAQALITQVHSKGTQITKVYAPGLDDPSSRTFERCSTDTFDIAGPCGYGICYLYLWRDGPDGWTPDWVQVYDPYYATYITFYYGSPIPPRIWYGFNHCNHLTTGAVAAAHDQ